MFGVFCPTIIFSSTPCQTEVLALLLRLEAVAVAATATVPEPRTFVLFCVKEPHHGVVLAATRVLVEVTGVWMETGEGLWWCRSASDQ